MSKPKAQKLLENLLQLQKELKELQAKLNATSAKRELTVSETERLFRVNSDLEELSYDHIPWARLSPDASRSAEIALWTLRRRMYYFGGNHG